MVAARNSYREGLRASTPARLWEIPLDDARSPAGFDANAVEYRLRR
jgi:hypothetical protein